MAAGNRYDVPIEEVVAAMSDHQREILKPEEYVELPGRIIPPVRQSDSSGLNNLRSDLKMERTYLSQEEKKKIFQGAYTTPDSHPARIR